jgi:hypothetical protein
MARPSARGLLIGLLSLSSWASPLDDAQKQIKDLQYAQASKTLKKVAAESDLSRDQVLQFYELSGIVAASMGDAKAARESFRRLLLLAPDFALKGRLAPRVTTPFAEARAAAREEPPFTIKVERTRVEGSLVTGLTVQRTGPIGWMKDVALRVDEEGVSREIIVGAAAGQVTVRGARVTATATARDARGWVLIATEPVTFETPRASPAVEKPIALTAPPSPPLTVADVEPEAPRYRPLAIGFGIAGGLALAGGIAAGVAMRGAENQARSATTDSNGVVTTLTRVQALALDEQAHQWATVANIGFVAAGVLVAAGVTTWILGSPRVTPVVAFLPGQGAVFAISGVLP